MTPPVLPNAPQIGSTGFVQRPGIVQQIAPILEAITQQKLANAQLENYHSLVEQRKAEAAQRAQDLQDQADAARAFYDHVSGNAVTIKPEPPSKDGIPSHQGVDNTSGTLIPLPQYLKRLSPGALVYYQKHIEGYNSDVVQQQQTLASQAQAEHTQTLDTIARQGMDEDRRIREVLAPLSGKDWNPRSLGRVVTRIAAINPQKAETVGNALGKFLPDYQLEINPNGTASYVPKQPGTGGVVGAPLQPKPPEKAQADLGNFATRILNAHARMTELEQAHPGIGQAVDDRLRSLRVAGALPLGAGKPLEVGLLPSILRTMSKPQREYTNLRIDLGNAILRRATGQQINMEEIDRETAPYVPISGQGDDILASIQERRLTQGLTAAESAGNGFNPNRLSPSARRLYLSSLVPHPGYSPDNPYDPTKLAQPGTAVVPQ